MSAPGRPRIIFMGTPAFAVPSLRALAGRYSVAGVVTQPDRPAGRGRQPVASPVKQWAVGAGLPLLQPARLREPAAQEQLTAWAPDLIVVAAFGQLLPPAVLSLPRYGCLNVHASLLPRWRGAAPIAAAIAAGDAETGVTLMLMDAGLDTGPMLAKRAAPIQPADTTAALTERLAELGAALLIDSLPDYLAGALPAEPQPPGLATYAPQLRKEAGRLDFARPAAELERQLRAVTPWPGAYTLWQDQPLKILAVRVLDETPAPAGTVFAASDGPAVACGFGAVALDLVQPAGKKPMAGPDFIRGARHFIGSILS